MEYDSTPGNVCDLKFLQLASTVSIVFLIKDFLSPIRLFVPGIENLKKSDKTERDLLIITLSLFGMCCINLTSPIFRGDTQPETCIIEILS